MDNSKSPPEKEEYTDKKKEHENVVDQDEDGSGKVNYLIRGN